MDKRKLILTLFCLVALVQLYVPVQMILEREDILETGKEFKFRTQPIDPNDPFRGKYITLSYKEDTIEIHDGTEWNSNETIYVILSKDKNGFAKINSVSKVKPGNDIDFVKARVQYVTDYGSHHLVIDYPFDRFYMEESKAPTAEIVYGESLRDTNQVAYALINIKDGETVIKDVLINETSIREMAKLRNSKGSE